MSSPLLKRKDIIPHNDTIYTFNFLVLNIEKSIKENKENNINNENKEDTEDILSQFIVSMEKLFNEIQNGNILEGKYTYINWLLKKTIFNGYE
jgi:hypothetical protein